MKYSVDKEMLHMGTYGTASFRLVAAMASPFDERPVWDLVYEGSFFPYLYDGRDGSLRGFIPIMWGIIGEALKKEIRYHQISNHPVQFDNVSIPLSDVLVSNGSYLAFVDGAQMNERRMQWARYTAPFLYGKYQIYESRGEHEHEVSFLSYFLVFSWSSILLLAICVITFTFTHWLHKKLLPKNHKSFLSHILLSAAQALFLLSVTLTTFYHGAYFRGDTIVTVPPKPTTLTQLLSSLDQLHRYLLLDVQGKATTAHLELFNNRLQVQPDKTMFFQQLCSDPKAFSFLFSGERYQRTIINSSRALSAVSISWPERTMYKAFEKFSLENSYFIVTPRNLTSRRLMERINGVILRMFQDEQISSLWNPRSVDSLRHYYDDEANPSAQFNPMSFEQLAIVFYLFFACMGAAILLMLFENLYHKLFHRRNLISALKSRSSAVLKKYSVAAREM